MTKAKSKLSLSKLNLTKQARMRAMLGAVICAAYSNAQALPTGEQVQAGDLSFVRDAQTLNINQTSQQAIVNWQLFGIAANEAVRLYQPNQGSALFRVLGTDSSQIYGNLSATGSLYLVNPNGVLFAPGSQVNVGGLLATTSQISDQNFLNKNYQFNGDSTASVVNQGAIRTEDGGFIVLLADTVENAGSLIADKGSVVLASAQTALLDMYGDGLVRVKLSGDALNAAINNVGSIIADGGAVQMAASARTAAINVNGLVQANSLVNRNGVIRLESGAKGTTLVNGKISAQGVQSGTQGGYVEITGNRVGLLVAADVNVSGAAAGGSILIGGDYQGKNAYIQNAERTYIADGASIKADALDSGNGGKVIVWADDTTRFYGNISAKGGVNGGNGGFVETSGKVYLDAQGMVDASAVNGLAGQWLLDPNNITIRTAGPNTNVTATPNFTSTNDNAIVTVGSIQTALNGGTSVSVTTGTGGANTQLGNITVANAILKNAGGNATLTLNAANNITFNAGANVTSTVGTLGLTLNAGGAINTLRNAALNGGVLTLNATGNVTQSGVISGTNTSVVKNGVGTFTASQNNTYTGATTINAGTLALGAANRIANGSALTVASGATFSMGNFAETVGSIAGGGNIARGTGALTAGGNNTSTSFSGVMSGTGAFTKQGTGTLTLSGANTYTGATNVNVGTLKLGAANRIANASAVTVSGGTFDIGAFSDTVGVVTLTNGAIKGTTGVLTGTSYEMQNGTVSAILGGAGALTKTTAGTVTLSGVNTYTGATAINAGTIIAANTNALGAVVGGTTVASGATLNVNAVTLNESTINVAGIGVGGNGALTGTGAAGITGTVTTTSGTKIGTTSGASVLTLSGAITAPGNLLISGAGDVLATNASNNFATVNISGAKNVGLLDANAIALGNGVSSLTGNLTVQAGGNVTVANNVTSTGGDITLAGTNFINTAGASALTTTGAGKRWLVYANTHTGNTFGGLNSGNQAVWNTAYPAAVSQTGKRYVFANNPGTLTVTSTSQSKTYGQDGAPIVANAYNVTGTFVNVATFGNVFTQDTIVNTVTGTATSTGSPVVANAGTYAIDLAPITATTGYTLTKNATGNLTVNPAVLTVTANNPANKTYGNTLTFAGTEFTTGAGELKNGETIGSATITSAGAAVTASVAGSPYAVTASAATGGTFNASNYDITYVNGSLTVVPLALTVTANSQTKTYGNADPALTYTSNAVNGDTFAGTLARAAGENVGSYAINQGSLNVGTNYTLTYIANNLAIAPRALTVTANPGQNKVFGSVDPLFTYVVGGLGLVNGDTLSGVLSRVAGETVGNYAINQGTLAASTNYQLTSYTGSNFAILIPSATSGGSSGGNNPRNASGLVDVNQALGNYTNPQLQVLNVGATAAGIDSEGNDVSCEAEPESKAKYKDSVLMLNSGLKLPKGVNASCDKT